MARPKKPREAGAAPRQQLNVRIPAAIAKRLGHYEVEHDLRRKRAAVVTEAIDEYLRKRGG